MTDIDNLKIGSRILYQIYPYHMTIYEGTLRAKTPSGRYLKIDDRWYERDNIIILEVLA